MIPESLMDGWFIITIDDYINPKTGRKIFTCSQVFDPVAKMNQSKYPWAQNILTIGLLLSHRFLSFEKNIEAVNQRLGKKKVEFETKLDQAVAMITAVAQTMDGPIL